MLLDSNILICSAKPGGEMLDTYVGRAEACISVVSRIESLGYHLLGAVEEAAIRATLGTLPELQLDAGIAARAVQLRQQKKMKLGDAIIAATALEFDMPLVTRNEADFKHITRLQIINPFTAPARPTV